jgi:hypothetical protein
VEGAFVQRPHVAPVPMSDQTLVNVEVCPWDMSFGVVNLRPRNPYGQIVFCVNLRIFLQVDRRPTGVRFDSTHIDTTTSC